MRQDRKCSLCGFIVHGNDSLHDERRRRHEEIHKDKGASRNKVIGIVRWDAVW